MCVSDKPLAGQKQNDIIVMFFPQTIKEGRAISDFGKMTQIIDSLIQYHPSRGILRNAEQPPSSLLVYDSKV